MRATLIKAVEAGRAAGVEGVVGFGGGSSLDVAKLAALLLGSNEDLDEAWGVAQAKGPRLPLVVVPTTAGTGSEVAGFIITVGEEEKRGVSSPIILPDVAVLDAELTLGLPPAITAATGIDAMVHAIEAYTSKSANNNPLSENARQAGAAAARRQHIGAAVSDRPQCRGAIARRCSARCWPGRAPRQLAEDRRRALHLTCPIGGAFRMPHGLSNALVLPHVMRFNAPDAAQLYAKIAADAFPDLAHEQGAQGRCAAVHRGTRGVVEAASRPAAAPARRRHRRGCAGQDGGRRDEAAAAAGQQSPAGRRGGRAGDLRGLVMLTDIRRRGHRRTPASKARASRTSNANDDASSAL